MGLIAMLPNYNPACRKSFTIVETVKEASAVCRSFLDGVVIFSWLLSISNLYIFCLNYQFDINKIHSHYKEGKVAEWAKAWNMKRRSVRVIVGTNPGGGNF